MKPSLFLLLAAATVLPGCRREPSFHLFTGETMGTTYMVKVLAGAGTDLTAETVAKLKARIAAILDGIQGKMSTYIAESELSRFNAHTEGAPFLLSAETREVFEIAIKIGKESQGALDITVGPLVNAWGFGPDGSPTRPPEAGALKALRDRVGIEKLKLSPDSMIAKSRPDVQCDLSSVAKGYAVDQIGEFLESSGIPNYMVEVGGEIRASGRNPQDLPWQIAIEKPLPGIRIIDQVVPLRNLSMATSGDYRNYYEVDGERVSHIVDPRTGRPVTHKLASVTVLHQKCALADGYATAIFVLGPEEGFHLASRLDLAAHLIVRGEGSFHAEMTPALKTYLGNNQNKDGDRKN